MTMTTSINEEIESAIDHSSVATILEVIATICAEKAEHVESNWQDARLARHWTDASDRIQLLADKLTARRVPGIGGSAQ